MLLVLTAAPAIELDTDDVNVDADKSEETPEETVAASLVVACTVNETSHVTDVASWRLVNAGPMMSDVPTPTTSPVALRTSSLSSKRLAFTAVKKSLMADSSIPIPEAIAALRICSLSSAGAFAATTSKVVTIRIVSPDVGAMEGNGVGNGTVGMAVETEGDAVGAVVGTQV